MRLPGRLGRRRRAARGHAPGAGRVRLHRLDGRTADLAPDSPDGRRALDAARELAIAAGARPA
jgi:hypothetical protein